MDDVAVKQVKSLDWKGFNEFSLLGDLKQFEGLVSDGDKRKLYSQLCTVVSHSQSSNETRIHSLSVYIALRLPKTSSGGDHVSRIDVADFYLKFFKEASVSKKQLVKFLSNHVTLVVARAIYHRRDTFHLQIVAALTFSRPKEDVPTYLAYLAVSDGSTGLPSLQDKNEIAIPDGSDLISGVVGYQGLGLGSMLISLLGKVVTSAIEPTPSALSCFLHYNVNNDASADGWLRHGFLLVVNDDESTTGDMIDVRDRYDELVVGMAGENVFKGSDEDTENIASMYTKFVTVDADPLDWYKTYYSDLGKSFIAKKTASVAAYALSNDDIAAKYRRRAETAPPNNLNLILETALARKEYRIKWDDQAVSEMRTVWSQGRENVPPRSKRARTSEVIPQSDLAKWTDQEYVDFACIQDENRTLTTDVSSVRTVGREKLVQVSVSSFLLPPDTSIEAVIEAETQNLPRFCAVVECNWAWLRLQAVDEVATVMEEALFGTPIIEGLGLDDTNWCTARKDVNLVGMFTAKKTRDHGFLSPPIGHKIIELPTNGFAKVGVTDGNPMRLIAHGTKTTNFRKHVRKTLKIAKVPPPLPRTNHQLSRLKWIPTGVTGASDETKYAEGYFEGAYRVPDTSHYSSVALDDDWVIHQFDPTFIQDVKVQGVTGQPSEKRRLISIPPGSSRLAADRPPNELLKFTKTSKYQQGENTTCLFDAFCSAMHEFGCVQQVKALRATPASSSVNQSNRFVWKDFNQMVNHQFKASGLQVFKQNIGTSVQSLCERDDSFVIVAALKSDDGMEGQHAIAIYAGCIYDSNSHYVLKKCQESLDWCCGGNGVSCTGIHRTYQLLPTHYKKLDNSTRLTVRMRDSTGADLRGWVAGLKAKRVHIKLANGTSQYVSFEELKQITRWLDGVIVA